MIVVTTPTGQIGSKVVEMLLDAGERVRAIARDPEKLPGNVRAAIEVIQGSSDDERVVSQALDGADALFWIVPPSVTNDDNMRYYVDFTRPVCRALQSRGVKRVVSVSGLGRTSSLASGPIAASFAKDAEIERTGVAYRALYCPGFMENLLLQAGPIKNQGAFFLPGRPDLKTPLVATRDIAATATKLLRDASWTDRGGVAVLGPEDLSFDDQAAIMTQVLGMPIRFEQIPGDAYKAQLRAFGASDSFAQGLVEMYGAIDEGLYDGETRNPENTTPTTFTQWCEEVLKPAVLVIAGPA